MLCTAHPPRHALLRVSAAGWAEVLAERPELQAEPLIVAWAARSRPLMARRRAAGDPDGMIAAGVPLPPAQGKRRVALTLRPADVLTVEPPPHLLSVRSAAPGTWSTTIDAVAGLGRRVSSAPRVFGSFAWAALTGLEYVTTASDLDLLWAADARTDLAALLSGLARLEEAAPGRLDGEVLHEPSGAAVNWRELHQDVREVLVKTSECVMLRPRTWFLALLAGVA